MPGVVLDCIYHKHGGTKRKMTTETQTTSHVHDLAFTISAGDLEPEQLAAMRRILEREVQALVERVNIETAALTGRMVGWYVSYDGSREHGCNA